MTIQEREAIFEVFPERMADDHSGQLRSIRKGISNNFSRSEAKEGTELLGVKILVEDAVPRLHSKGLNIIIQVMAEEIRKGLFFIS